MGGAAHQGAPTYTRSRPLVTDQDLLASTRIRRLETDQDSLACTRLGRLETDQDSLASTRLRRLETDQDLLASTRLGRLETDQDSLALAVDDPTVATGVVASWGAGSWAPCTAGQRHGRPKARQVKGTAGQRHGRPKARQVKGMVPHVGATTSPRPLVHVPGAS